MLSNWYAVVQVNNPNQVPEGQAWVSSEYVTTDNMEAVPTIPAPVPPPNIDLPSPDPNGAIATTLDVINLRQQTPIFVTFYPKIGESNVHGDIGNTHLLFSIFLDSKSPPPKRRASEWVAVQ